MKNSKNSDTHLLNKINIALSDSNNSQNIECKVGAGSIHEITISSKTGEHSKLQTHHIKINSKKSSRSRSRSKSNRSICKDEYRFNTSHQESNDRRNFRIPKRKLIVKKLKKKKGSKNRSFKLTQNNRGSIFDSTDTPKSPIVVKTVKKFKQDFERIKKNFERKLPKSQVCSPIRKHNIIVSSEKVNQRITNFPKFHLPEDIKVDKILQDIVEDEPDSAFIVKLLDNQKAEADNAPEFIFQENEHHERDSGNEKLESNKASSPEPIINDETPCDSSDKSEEQNIDNSVRMQASRSGSPELSVPLRSCPIDTKVKSYDRVNQSPLMKGKKLLGSSDRMNTSEELKSEDNMNNLSSSNKLAKSKGHRKPSEHLLVTKGLLQDQASIATVNHSSDKVTAHFNSTRQKSISSHDSPTPVRDTVNSRVMHQDPISFLHHFDLLFNL